MPHSERLVKLLELLHAHPGMEADDLSRACGISARTLQRDLDALTAAGFPVYFDHGYRLAAPMLLPAITLTADEALALKLAAQAAASRAEPAAARSLAVAGAKLAQALATKPPERPPDGQLALALSVRDPRTDKIAEALASAITEHRSVKLTYVPARRGGARARRVDPYRLLHTAAGWTLLAYCPDRHRIQRIPVAHLEEAVVMRRRFRPVTARVLERHLHRGPAIPAGPHRVRLICRPPLAESLRRHPPVGVLELEDGPEGGLAVTLAALRIEDLVPWLLACGDAIEVREPAGLRQEIHRIARDLAARHASRPLPSSGIAAPDRRDHASPSSPPGPVSED